MAEQRVQRRLAAILAADVVGYGRLMREDETGTLAQLKTLRKEVFGLDPFPWTPDQLGERSPRCRLRVRLIRPSSGSRWSS